MSLPKYRNCPKCGCKSIFQSKVEAEFVDYSIEKMDFEPIYDDKRFSITVGYYCANCSWEDYTDENPINMFNWEVDVHINKNNFKERE